LSTYHRLLGLPPQRPTMDDYFNLATLPQAMQEALLREELSLESARRLTRFPRSDAEALFRLIAALRPGVNRQRELIDWLEEIAGRLGWSMARVAQQPEIEACLNAIHLTPVQRAELVRERLRAQRFPHLVEQEERLRAQVPALGLKPPLRLTHDPPFED